MTHSTGDMQQGAAPSRPAALRATRRPLPANRVVTWEARAPHAPAGSLRVWEALQQLQPGLYPSVSAAKKAVRRAEVLVDGEVPLNPSITLAGGELLQCVQRAGAADCVATAAAGGGGVQAALTPLLVAYEDEHMACIVKPPGIPTDSPPGRSGGGEQGPPPAAPSVYTLLPHSLVPSQALGALRRPRHCHRLDEPTGGLLLVGKTRVAQAALCGALADRKVTKRYRALVWGRLEGRGRLTWVLDARHCDTEYRAVQHTRVDLAGLEVDSSMGGCGTGVARSNEQGAGPAAEGPAAPAGPAAAAAVPAAEHAMAAAAAAAEPAAWVTTVDLWPHTGRKHQLRRHLALLGHPLVGDRRYTFGYAALREAAGLALEPEGHQVLPGGPLIGGDMPAGYAEVKASDGAAVAAALAVDLPGVAQAATAAHGLKLCLWAVELQLEQHPVSGQPMRFEIPEPPAFASVRAALAGTGGV